MINILYFFKERETPMYLWQRYHIIDDLQRHGCRVTIFNPLKFDSVEHANESLIKEIETVPYDLFMTPHNEHDIHISTIDRIKSKGIPTLLICFDNLTVPHMHKTICKYFDLVWLTSVETKYLFDKWGSKSIFLPYAANPALCQPSYNSDILKVLFIGTPYGSRAKMINTLLNSDIPVSLYANISPQDSSKKNAAGMDITSLFSTALNMLSYPIGRRLMIASIKNKMFRQSTLNANSEDLEIHPPVPLDVMMSTYSRYAISLSSVANRHTGVLKHPVNIVNLRSFEIPAAAGLLFCSYNPELAGYFEDGKEAIYYTDDYDMIDKARFYLSPHRISLRQNMKNAARMRATNEHTWYCRFTKVFDNFGLRYDK